MLGPCFTQYLVSFLAVILTGYRELVDLPLIVFLMSCDCLCCVALPRGAVV